MKKFEEFQSLREAAILLAGVDEKTCKLSDYAHKLEEAAEIKKEIQNYMLTEMEEVVLDFSDLDETNESEYDDLLEAELLEKIDLKTSTNPLARLFRWVSTLRAKKKIESVYKASLQAKAASTANEIKLEVKKDEVAKISGPESKVKSKEIDGMLDVIKQKREMIDQKKKDQLDKIQAGGLFGINKDVIDKHIALMNAQEKLQLAEMKANAAKTILTDKQMADLKNSIKTLKARDTKYTQELAKVEQRVKDSVDKDKYEGEDKDMAEELDAQREKIQNIDSNIEEVKAKQENAKDDEKKELAAKIVDLQRDKKAASRQMDKIEKKAAKSLLGSVSTEK
jgi:hypothetical protein